MDSMTDWLIKWQIDWLIGVGAQVYDSPAGLQPGRRGAHPHYETQAAHRTGLGFVWLHRISGRPDIR